MVGDAIAGCIQFTEETDPDYHSASIDVFVADAWQDRGVGSDAMRTLIAYLVGGRGHHRLTVDPAAANARAIHVYERLGFRPVGTMHAYERVADATWRDALLMELVIDKRD
jgi:aminoglycoside 6'-N-acetyltransferase